MELVDLDDDKLLRLTRRLKSIITQSQKELKTKLDWETNKFLQETQYYIDVEKDPSKRNRMQEIEWDLSPEAWDSEDPVR